VNPRDLLASAGKRMTDPVETLAQRVAERVVDLLVVALDVNALVARVDMNAVLALIDVDEVLAKVDVNALLERVDVNAVLERADLNAVLRRVDVGAVLDRVVANPGSSSVIEVANPDGTGRHSVSPRAWTSYSPTWTPSGKIVFLRQTGAPTPSAAAPTSAYVVNRNGTGLRLLYPNLDAIQIAWGPAALPRVTC
jgi:hypothetical protein